jgi:hypothetical protein
MSEFYDEVSLTRFFRWYQPPARSPSLPADPLPLSEQSATLILGLSPLILDLIHPRQFEAVQRKRLPHFRTSLEIHQYHR